MNTVIACLLFYGLIGLLATTGIAVGEWIMERGDQ